MLSQSSFSHPSFADPPGFRLFNNPGLVSWSMVGSKPDWKSEQMVVGMKIFGFRKSSVSGKIYGLLMPFECRISEDMHMIT